jgi:hypothetical protein
VLMMSVLFIYYFGDSSNMEWLSTVTVSHMVHVKLMSLIFLIDITNERLEVMINLTKTQNADVKKLNSIFTEIFYTSRLIHKIYGKITSLIILIFCASSTNGLYGLFLKVSKIDETYGYLDICGGTLTDGFMVVMLCNCSNRMEKLGKTFSGIFHNCSSTQRKIDEFHIIEKLSTECFLNKIVFKGVGSLHVKNSMCVDILSIVAPFFIIIIQFEMFFNEK